MSTEAARQDHAAARRKARLAYTEWIEGVCRKDPGARKALRDGIRRDINAVRRMHRLITPLLPNGGDTSDGQQRAYYAIAAMIADQPRSRFSQPGPDPSEDEADVPASAGQAKADTEPETGDFEESTQRATRYGPSLGTAFALAVIEGPGRDRQMRESTAEKQLNLLTRQSVNGLYRHLPASVRYLRSLDVPVDFAQLLDDLLAWPVHSGRISRRWLQDFYWLRAKEEREAAREPESEESGESRPE